jgi:hypothetical protein
MTINFCYLTQKLVLDKKYVNFSLRVLFERFSPPINIKYVVLKLYTEKHHGKWLSFLIDFNQNWKVSTNFSKTPQSQIS